MEPVEEAVSDSARDDVEECDSITGVGLMITIGKGWWEWYLSREVVDGEDALELELQALMLVTVTGAAVTTDVETCVTVDTFVMVVAVRLPGSVTVTVGP